MSRTHVLLVISIAVVMVAGLLLGFPAARQRAIQQAIQACDTPHLIECSAGSYEQILEHPHPF